MLRQKVRPLQQRRVTHIDLERLIPRTGNFWEDKIREMLIKVTLYQLGYYPAEKLGRELDEFFRLAIKPLCQAIRRNGGICFQELLEDMSPSEAVIELGDQISQFNEIGRYQKTMKYVANLLQLSFDLYRAKDLPLSKKILIFDKLVHAVHGAGAYLGDLVSYEEASIFGVNIPKVKREANAIIEKILNLLRR